MRKNKNDDKAVKVRKSKDVLAYFWEDVLKSKSRYFKIVCFLFVLNLLSYAIVFYYVFFHKERVILIDPTGRPFLSYTYKDEGVFKTELHRFFLEVVTLVYEKSYVDFLDVEVRNKLVKELRVFFASNDDLSAFLDAYFKSPFVQSLVNNKYVTKVGETSALDVVKDQKEDVLRAIGKVKVSAYLENNVVKTQYKTVELVLAKGTRTTVNPFGLYLRGFYERKTEEVR